MKLNITNEKNIALLDVLSEDLQKEVAKFHNDQDLKAHRDSNKLSSRLFQPMINERLILKQLRLPVIMSQQDEIETLEHPYIPLLLQKQIITDSAKRTFPSCSVLQYAAWATDVSMINTILQLILADKKKHLASFVTQLKELREKGVSYTKNGRVYVESEYNYAHIDSAYRYLQAALTHYSWRVDQNPDDWENPDYANMVPTNNRSAMTAAYQAMLLSQKEMPMCVIHDLCQKRDRPVNTVADFKTQQRTQPILFELGESELNNLNSYLYNNNTSYLDQAMNPLWSFFGQNNMRHLDLRDFAVSRSEDTWSYNLLSLIHDLPVPYPCVLQNGHRYASETGDIEGIMTDLCKIRWARKEVMAQLAQGELVQMNVAHQMNAHAPALGF